MLRWPEWENSFTARNERPYVTRRPFSKPIHAKEERNGAPSTNPVLFTAKPRSSHAVCTLQVHPSTSSCPALIAGAEPKSQGHCQKWYHKLKICDIKLYASIVFNWLVSAEVFQKLCHFQILWSENLYSQMKHTYKIDSSPLRMHADQSYPQDNICHK